MTIRPGPTASNSSNLPIPSPKSSTDLFGRFGFMPVARHKTKDITVYRQGDINYILNAEPQSFGMKFVEKHGPCAPCHGLACGRCRSCLPSCRCQWAPNPMRASDKTLDVPAIKGIGGSLLYFVDRYGEKGSPTRMSSNGWARRIPGPRASASIISITSPTMSFAGIWTSGSASMPNLFNFSQIRFFDIEGKYTGLFSRALNSPCGKIRIPINESADDKSQIEEYLRKYKGEGIQHIAIATEDIYSATDALAANGVRFMPPPPDTYYEKVPERVKGHREPIDRLKKHGILIDGEGVVDGGETKVLLQIFSRTVIGPIFFEFIQRKGDEGFGEGNFRALFESIEEDQVRRGVLDPKAA